MSVTMYFNLTQMNGSIEGLLQFSDQLSEGVFGFAFMLGLFIIAFSVMVSNGASPMKAALASSFLFNLVGYLFVAIKILTVDEMLLPTIAFLGLIIMVMLEKQ